MTFKALKRQRMAFKVLKPAERKHRENTRSDLQGDQGAQALCLSTLNILNGADTAAREEFRP